MSKHTFSFYMILAACSLLIPIACTQTAKTETAATANEQLVRKYFALFNRHAWQDMANMYTSTVAFKDPSFGDSVVQQTREQIRSKYATLNDQFPDIHDELIQLYTSGDKHVVVEFVSTGTAPDSSKFRLPICTIFTIENGLITHDYTYYDYFE